MPTLITTRTRIADQGKPRTIKFSGELGEPEVVGGIYAYRIRTVFFDTDDHHFFQPLPHQAGTSSLVYHFNKNTGLTVARPEDGFH